MNQIHDRTDDPHWSENVDDWEGEFEIGDVILSPGHDHFRTMTVVSQIEDNPWEMVTRKGIFWDEEEAQRYAGELV